VCVCVSAHFLLSIPPPYSPRSSFRTAAKGDGGEKGLRKKAACWIIFIPL